MPAPKVLYFIDEQLEDIIRECCRPNFGSILSIDTTFNVGDFNVTTTMYQSEKVISKKTAKPTNLPGPAMFHTTKTQRDYLHFAHTLLENNYALERIAFVGRDRDRDKVQSFFLKPLKGCTFLPCKKHLEGDITQKIADLSLTSIKCELL